MAFIFCTNFILSHRHPFYDSTFKIDPVPYCEGLSRAIYGLVGGHSKGVIINGNKYQLLYHI